MTDGSVGVPVTALAMPELACLRLPSVTAIPYLQYGADTARTFDIQDPGPDRLDIAFRLELAILEPLPAAFTRKLESAHRDAFVDPGEVAGLRAATEGLRLPAGKKRTLHEVLDAWGAGSPEAAGDARGPG